MTERFIGLMSGTSLDGVDGVLVDFRGDRCTVVHHVHHPLPEDLRASLLALNTPGPNELHQAAIAGNSLSRRYAAAVRDLLNESQCPADAVAAIGAHGQTVRHQPRQHDETGYTVQLHNPALLAELTGIDVVADFRSRDLAAGGQGAPLVPVFHQFLFGRRGSTVSVLNIGGIANLSVLRDLAPLGFDCGPGNVLLDAWCWRHTGRPFDYDGAWAASGTVQTPLLERLQAEPYFRLAPPKSSGRDLFNLAWLDRHLEADPALSPADVQATLLELTAWSCREAVLRHAKDCQELFLCGGGALNTTLVGRLQRLLPHQQVRDTGQLGLPPMQVEATAFAWLARQTVRRQALALQNITGAKGARVLGAVYPR